MPAEVRKDLVILAALLLLGAAAFAFLPSAASNVFASPDETAVFETARRFASGQSAARPEVLADSYPWLHPRSWVSQGQRIVPVGFLGWPWFLHVFMIFGPQVAPFVASLLILSSLIPLYFLLKRFGSAPALLGCLVFLTYPPILLYGNRSLFPNASCLALALWGAWAIHEASKKPSNDKIPFWLKHVFIGVVCGLALAIRPYEALWILPWWILAGWNWRPNRRAIGFVVLGAALAILPLLFHAQLAYGAFWKSGYMLSDNALVQTATPTPSVGSVNILDRILPYGFHPRAIASNVRSFLLGYALPWTLLAALGALVAGIGLRKWGMRTRLMALAAAWTALVLLVTYGSGAYADHVRADAVTIGNSFLRYLLPLAVACAFASAFLISWLSTKNQRGRLAILAAVFLLSIFGTWKAFSGDDESILAVRPELKRYEIIRAAAGEWFSEKDVIISERSDKIFFPVYRAVSPLPPSSEVGRLVRTSDVRVGLFVRPMSQKDRDAWRVHGVEAVELASYGRERLYLLRAAGL